MLCINVCIYACVYAILIYVYVYLCMCLVVYLSKHFYITFKGILCLYLHLSFQFVDSCSNLQKIHLDMLDTARSRPTRG